MKSYSLIFFLLIFSCQNFSKKNDYSSKGLTSFVNTFVGTGGHGHTYPGATLPFGMMQLSPDTRLDGWDGCSGYHYSDNYIYGFSHTHLSGTGVSDYADVLLMPTNKVIFNNGIFLITEEFIIFLKYLFIYVVNENIGLSDFILIKAGSNLLKFLIIYSQIVVLPAPLGPNKPMTSPELTSKDIF